ncbi:MAG: nucleotidyltransferase family protein [Candidatus Kapabacteria bacterium]|nr:nucleotidyltransferase family protein [Ignavibacteriota bacterium]MCW5884075.1 nucleotidyltransferase family protein [Candidatus Kapabacteria bacterium]
MSRKSKVELEISQKADILKKYCVKSLALFGSVARGDDDENSDIDILVNFEKSTYRNFIGLKDYLEELFRTKVDLVCENSIKPMMKPYILKDVKWLVN